MHANNWLNVTVILSKNKRNKNMTTYRKSNGNRIKKSVIDARVRKAKAEKLQNQFDEFEYNFCESIDCGSNGSGTRLDCAHIISVKKCQERGQSELAYAVSNISIQCRECHQKYDKLNLQFGNS